MNLRGRIPASLSLGLAVAGCAGSGVRRDEIPDAPIAVFYRDAEQARRRAERFTGKQPAIAPREGVAHADAVADYVSQLLGRAPQIDENELLGRLALIDPRTRELTPVGAALPGATPLDWSQDHRRLLFSQNTGGLPQLFEFDRESGEVRPITRGPSAHPQGCFGPEGRYVVTTARVQQGRATSRIALTNSGGSDPLPISPGPQDHDPSCAPDGSAAVWVSSAGRVPILVSRAPLVDGELRTLVPGRDPDFSGDGRWVVYSAPASGSWKLYRIRPDGSGRAPVGREPLEEQQPAVSPDSLLVVYVNEVEHRSSLYLRRFDGSGDRILFQDGDATYPTW